MKVSSIDQKNTNMAQPATDKTGKQLKRLAARIKTAVHVKPTTSKFDRHPPKVEKKTTEKTKHLALFNLIKRKASSKKDR